MIVVWLFLYWQDMNDPSNFLNGTVNGCPNTTLDNPPYLPSVDGQTLYHHTLCMSAKHYNGLAHYDVHNIYGLAEALVTSLWVIWNKFNHLLFICCMRRFILKVKKVFICLVNMTSYFLRHYPSIRCSSLTQSAFHFDLLMCSGVTLKWVIQFTTPSEILSFTLFFNAKKVWPIVIFRQITEVYCTALILIECREYVYIKVTV